jgi:pre-mRNA-splicing factor SYF1
MFEKVLSQAPVKQNKIFFLMYADFEETHGLINHAIEIYDRMVQEVEYGEKLQTYNLYISKVAKLLGITKTRRIFEKAVETLEDEELI